MSILSFLFNELLYNPLLNALMGLYSVIPGNDLGVAIILLTIIIRLLLYPLNDKALRSQKVMQDLQPDIKAVQEKYKNDKEGQAKAMMELYRVKKINPFSGCLMLLIQLPILIALYWVFIAGLDPEKSINLYSFIPNPGAINTMFLGFLDLSKNSPLLAILTGVSQFLHSRMVMHKQDAGAKDQKKDAQSDMMRMMRLQMLYFFPVFIVIIAWNFPAGLPLYWLTMTVFSVGQQYLINKKLEFEGKSLNQETGAEKK